MSEALPVWTCAFAQAPGESAHPMNNLTVGSKFSMKCQGDIPVSWSKEPLAATFAKKEEAYILAVLSAERLEANAAELTVTSYKAGQHNPEYLRIVQGANGFEVAKPEWEIRTVLKKDEQPPQPFAPFGPWALGFPLWIVVSVLLFLLLAGVVVFRKVRKYAQRKKMLEELARHKTALSPIHQFYRDARQLRRRLNLIKSKEEVKAVAEDLNRDFRLYVLRQFEIPTLDWSDRAIVDDLRKRHRQVYNQAADPLKKTLRELTRLRTQVEVNQADVEQLHRMSMDTAERIEGAVEMRGGRR